MARDRIRRGVEIASNTRLDEVVADSTSVVDVVKKYWKRSVV